MSSHSKVHFLLAKLYFSKGAEEELVKPEENAPPEEAATTAQANFTTRFNNVFEVELP